LGIRSKLELVLDIRSKLELVLGIRSKLELVLGIRSKLELVLGIRSKLELVLGSLLHGRSLLSFLLEIHLGLLDWAGLCRGTCTYLGPL